MQMEMEKIEVRVRGETECSYQSDQVVAAMTVILHSRLPLHTRQAPCQKIRHHFHDGLIGIIQVKVLIVREQSIKHLFRSRKPLSHRRGVSKVDW